MVSDNDTDILVFEFSDDILDILNGDRVDSSERLIKKDELRIDREGTRNLATTTLTSRKLDTLALADFMQIELIQKVFQAL